MVEHFLLGFSVDIRDCPLKSNNFRMEDTHYFQAEHALYTPGLDDNRGSSDFVHDIWICYKVQYTKFCTRQ